MPNNAFRQAVKYLLLIIMVMQPVLAFGQVTLSPSGTPLRAEQATMMDCCKGGLHTPSSHSDQTMACGDMTSADCAFAASLGNCGSAMSALAPEKATMAALLVASLEHFQPQEGYLSVILDTLTPPPNSSKA